MSKPIDHVATFVAGPGVDLTQAAVMSACAFLPNPQFDWLEIGVAADVRFALGDRSIPDVRLRLPAALDGKGVDVVAQPIKTRRKALLVADMDIDDDHAGMPGRAG